MVDLINLKLAGKMLIQEDVMPEIQSFTGPIWLPLLEELKVPRINQNKKNLNSPNGT